MLKDLFEKSWFVFVIAILLGLIFPMFSSHIEPFLTYFLIILMTFSLKDIGIGEVFDKTDIKKPFKLFFMTLLASVVIIVGSWILIKDEAYLQGMIVMAAVPCAIAVIPYTKLLKGDLKNTIRALLITYGFYLFLTPLIIWVFFQETINPFDLFLKTFYFVIIPLILSRPLRKINNKLKKYDKLILHSLFFILIYTTMGINSRTIMGDLLSLRYVFLILLIRTFFLFILLYYFYKKGLNKFRRSKLVMFGYKNLGYALVLSLLLFSRESAIPITLGLLFENLSFVALDKIMVRG